MWPLNGAPPLAHTRDTARLLPQGPSARCWGRTLDHRGSQRGLRVRTFRGIAVLPEEARAWFEAHPVQRP